MSSQPILLIPMAGQASRFKKAGIQTPKQLLPAGGRNCLERSLDSFRNLPTFSIVFGVNDARVGDAAAAYAKANKLNAQVVMIGDTAAPTETLDAMLKQSKGLSPDAPVYVFTMDIEIYPAVNIDANFTCGGTTYVFTSATPSYSYVKIEDGRVTAIAEKQVISPHANVGLYGFRTLAQFQAVLQQCEADRKAKPRETHVSDLIRMLIPTERFEIRGVEGVHVFGTPQEYDFYTQYVLPQRQRKRIALFSDHSGFATKARFITALTDAGFEVKDHGAWDANMSSYAVFAASAVASFKKGECDLVMGFCRTGQGVNIALNKLSPTLLAAVIYDENALEFALSHNCARGFCFPDNIWLEKDLDIVVDTLRNVPFEGGRHTDRLRNVVKGYLTPDMPSGAGDIAKLEQFKGGWLVGAFDPALVSTGAVEVAVKKAGARDKPDGHFHKIATEYTLILEGQAEDNGRLYGPGEIITLRPMEKNYTKFLEDTLMLCIKTPSVTDDKYDG